MTENTEETILENHEVSLEEILEQKETVDIALLPEEEYNDDLLEDSNNPDDVPIPTFGFSLSRYTKMPLLSPEKERNLLQAISEGEQAKRRLPYARSQEEREVLEQKIREGQASLSELVVANIGLVYYAIRVFLGPTMVANDDLVQEGAIGMIKAARRYTPECGTRFSTYAIYWIKHAIFRAVRSQMREMRLPMHTEEKISRICYARNQLIQQLHREPTISEISAFVKMTPKKVEELIALARPFLSLDASIVEEDDGFSLGDIIPSPIPDPADVIAERELKGLIREIVGRLPDQEREVIQRLYAIDSDPTSFAEMGRERNISKEAVRQRAKRAMARLKHPRVRRMLAGFL